MYITIRNIIRNKKQSLITMLICVLFVELVTIYLGNMQSNRNQLNHLSETIPVQCQITNLNGTKSTGIWIDETLSGKLIVSGQIKDAAYGIQMLAGIGDFPAEDCIPDESIKIHVNQVLNGDKNLEGAELWLCDHTNENPSMLFHDKNYVAHIALCGYAHGSHMEEGLWDAEYAPVPLVTSQYDENGNLMEDMMEKPQAYYEVVSGFFLTKEGKRYLNYAKALSLPDRTFPVTGTGATMLLMPFYQGEAYICEGRDISEEEYETGEAVCLVSREFAQNNGLSVGDPVHTSLYYTNSRNAASRNYAINGNQGFDFNLNP